MPFTQTQADAMPVAEVEVRVCRRSNCGGYGTTNWDQTIDADAGMSSSELLGLLWPDVYPAWCPPHVCSTWTETAAAAARIGVSTSGYSDPDALARYLLVWADIN